MENVLMEEDESIRVFKYSEWFAERRREYAHGKRWQSECNQQGDWEYTCNADDWMEVLRKEMENTLMEEDKREEFLRTEKENVPMEEAESVQKMR